MPQERRERDPYDLKMDALAKRVSHALEGENLLDVASVCGALAAFAIAEMPVDEREQMLEKIIAFMRYRVFADAVKFHEQHRWQ